MDCSLQGSCLHGILQARVLEWVAISFSRDLPDPGIEPGSPALQADALPSEPIVACGAVPELWHVGSVVMVHGLSYSEACGVFPDQGLNPCPCIGG